MRKGGVREEKGVRERERNTHTYTHKVIKTDGTGGGDDTNRQELSPKTSRKMS